MPLPRMVYAGGWLVRAELGGAYLQIGLALPETRIGPPRLFTVSGAAELAERPEIHANLLGQAWARLNTLPSVQPEEPPCSTTS